MCGRTVSTLGHNQLRQACTYTNRHGRRMRPGWRNRGPRGGGGGGGGGGNGGQGGSKRGTSSKQPQSDSRQQKPSSSSQDQTSGTMARKYYPSYNIAPTRATPVLVSSKHFQDKSTEVQSPASDEREIMPMVWGLVPSWHKGTAKDMSYKMNNCRSEGMLEKVSFKRPFEKGQRCVVLVDGFYEWKTDKNQKQPYFIYFAQEHPPTDLSISPEEEGEETEESLDQEVIYEPSEVSESDPKWTGHRLLTMAGLFDKWYPPQGGDPLYTYTVITVAANDSFSWLHHRMPAILDGDEEIKAWLDFGSVDCNKRARSLISARSCLSLHPVTRSMGNIRYKDPDCIKPIELGKPEKPKLESASSKLMSSWLAKGSKSADGKSQLVKTEGGDIKGERSPKKKTGGGPLTKWLVKKEKVEEGEAKKRPGDEVAVKQEQPSPKRSRVH